MKFNVFHYFTMLCIAIAIGMQTVDATIGIEALAQANATEVATIETVIPTLEAVSQSAPI